MELNKGLCGFCLAENLLAIRIRGRNCSDTYDLINGITEAHTMSNRSVVSWWESDTMFE